MSRGECARHSITTPRKILAGLRTERLEVGRQSSALRRPAGRPRSARRPQTHPPPPSASAGRRRRATASTRNGSATTAVWERMPAPSPATSAATMSARLDADPAASARAQIAAAKPAMSLSGRSAVNQVQRRRRHDGRGPPRQHAAVLEPPEEHQQRGQARRPPQSRSRSPAREATAHRRRRTAAPPSTPWRGRHRPDSREGGADGARRRTAARRGQS